MPHRYGFLKGCSRVGCGRLAPNLGNPGACLHNGSGGHRTVLAGRAQERRRCDLLVSLMRELASFSFRQRRCPALRSSPDSPPPIDDIAGAQCFSFRGTKHVKKKKPRNICMRKIGKVLLDKVRSKAGAKKTNPNPTKHLGPDNEARILTSIQWLGFWVWLQQKTH